MVSMLLFLARDDLLQIICYLRNYPTYFSYGVFKVPVDVVLSLHNLQNRVKIISEQKEIAAIRHVCLGAVTCHLNLKRSSNAKQQSSPPLLTMIYLHTMRI